MRMAQFILAGFFLFNMTVSAACHGVGKYGDVVTICSSQGLVDIYIAPDDSDMPAGYETGFGDCCPQNTLKTTPDKPTALPVFGLAPIGYIFAASTVVQGSNYRDFTARGPPQLSFIS